MIALYRVIYKKLNQILFGVKFIALICKSKFRIYLLLIIPNLSSNKAPPNQINFILLRIKINC